MKESPEKEKIQMDVSVSDSEDDESDSSDSSGSGSGSDSSESSDEDVNVVLKVTYHLTHEKAVSLQKNYICHMCGSSSSGRIATASSNFSSSLYDLESLQSLAVFEEHTSPITNLRFHPNDPNQLISSSTDGTIRFWDTRKSGKSVLTFKDDTAGSGKLKPFLSFDISKSGHFLCAGTEVFDGDAFLVFGDARSCKVLGGYWESHSDDITQVSFHPLIPDNVASGSSDGLINIYDLKKDTEDDALVDSLNTESTVDKLTWYLLNGTHKGIACILDTMDVQLWTQDGAAPISTFSRKHVANSTGWKASKSNIINIHQTSSEDLLFLAGGSVKESDRLALLQVKDKDLLVESELPGNKQRVRCSWFHPESGSLVTAGENGIISHWRPGAEPVTDKAPKVLAKTTSTRLKPY
ncbi:WD repeat-containing protein 89 [Thrips palmi]|uniref:WD repeat-containing protein 89 n=1 Tax=Thrips palmi TaxID=161013 RepID=A0A6P8Z210_THRPL|nr:WD repeat-containing protein 89 [Thrips palmi]